MKTIVTLTMNPALDLFLEVPQLLPDRKLRCGSPMEGAGGGGINVSRAIRGLGGTSTALFPAGGATGDRLIQLLEREAIAVNHVRTAEPTRQNVNVLDEATVKEYRFILPGPQLGIDEWKHCLRALQSISPLDYVVASGSLPRGVPVDFFARVAEMARALGFRLIVDTSGEPLRYAAVPGTFLLKPNLRELAQVSGVDGITGMAVEGAARAIVASGKSEVVVVSAGAAGAILVHRHGVRRIAAPVVRFASKIGAGDSMVAGIVLALASGADIDDAVTFGVAAGSAAVMRTGHQLCRQEDAERLYEQMRRSSTVAPMSAA